MVIDFTKKSHKDTILSYMRAELSDLNKRKRWMEEAIKIVEESGG